MMRRFSTNTGDLRRLADWLAFNECKDVCMESTGKYWVPVYNILEETCNVCLTHPKYVKAIKGQKTDKRDAKWIAELFKCDLVRSSFIPPFEIRQLRDLCRYHTKLTWVVTAEKNRIQNSLTTSNFKLDAVFSDVFGKSASRILDSLLALGHSNFEIAPLLDKRCKATIEEVRAAIDGQLSYAQGEKIKLMRLHMDHIKGLQDSLELLIMELAEPYLPQIGLLLTVPGISSKLTAIKIIGEIGADMSVFETSKHLSSWAGVAPQNNESAGKKKTTRISRAGVYLKPLLVQVALAASRTAKHPEIMDKYQQLLKRRGHKKSIIAITRRILTAIWHMFSKNEPYNAKLYHKADKPPASRVLTPEQAFDLLRRKGYQIVEPDSVAKQSSGDEPAA